MKMPYGSVALAIFSLAMGVNALLGGGDKKERVGPQRLFSCQYSFDECSKYATESCNKLMGKPLDALVDFQAVTYRRGRECSWICPNSVPQTCVFVPTNEERQ